MVRRNELACRDEWTRTLWEEGTFGEPEAASARPVDPATEVEVAALVRTGLDTDVAASADVVLGEARLVSDATPPWRLPAAGLALTAPPPPPAAGFDSRTAILRAREAYRERQKSAERLQASTSAPDPGDLAGSAVPTPADADSAIAAAGISGRLGSEAPPAEASADLPESDHERWPTDSPEFVWAGEAGGPIAEAAEDERDATPERFDESFVEPGFAASLLSEYAAGPAGAATVDSESAAAPQWDAIPVEPLPAETDAWSPARPGWSAEPTSAGSADWSPVGVQPPEEEWWEPVASGTALSAPQPAPDADGGWRGTPVWDEAWIAELARESARGEHWAEWDRNTEDEEQPEFEPAPAVLPEEEAATSLDMAEADDRVVDLPLAAVARFEIAPGVPRVCRTCRDFRPADGGDRGWCANQWAFTHRRLVDPDEPAPCESSIGSWWLPADELYIGDADISAHGLATPLLDRWLPGHVTAEPERKQS